MGAIVGCAGRLVAMKTALLVGVWTALDPAEFASCPPCGSCPRSVPSLDIPTGSLEIYPALALRNQSVNAGQSACWQVPSGEGRRGAGGLGRGGFSGREVLAGGGLGAWRSQSWR